MSAAAPLDRLTSFIQRLVRIRTLPGDSPAPLLLAILERLSQAGIKGEILYDAEQQPLALTALVRGAQPGPVYLLNAPADTAPVGDADRWRYPPFAAEIADGWLYGRGSADSKAGIALFCEVAEQLNRDIRQLHGAVLLVFDAEEHNGTFRGIKRALEAAQTVGPLAGGFIGYPGLDRIMVGGRGFYRCRLHVHGIAAHSGSASRRGINAIARTAHLVGRLEDAQQSLPAPHDPDFPLPPSISVTAVQAGEGFSTVPDLCVLNVDCRLTPAFDAGQARALVTATAAAVDRDMPSVPATQVHELEGWPAYRVARHHPVLSALRRAAEQALGHAVAEEIAGPSSIGNYLATLGIQATTGFGVRCRNLHAADECMEVGSLAPALQAYLGAMRALLGVEK